MSHIWLIFAGMLIATSARSASSTSGNCASIGYSTSCCPPSEGDNCQAADGDCYCNPICHFYGDCCEDVYCPTDPSTCADFGITQCCNGSGHCSVYDYNYSGSNDYRCSCDASCHERNDCCSDAQVFCMACTVARKYPDCCNRVDASACYVPGAANCYCDPLCTLYHDCCDDAETHLLQCGSNRFSRMRLQSFQNYKESNRRRFYNRDQTTYQRRENAIGYQEAPAGRVQRMFMNEREFRSRRRMAGRSSA